MNGIVARMAIGSIFCAPGDPKCGSHDQNRAGISGQLVRLVHHHGKCVFGGNFMHVVRRFFYQLSTQEIVSFEFETMPPAMTLWRS